MALTLSEDEDEEVRAAASAMMQAAWAAAGDGRAGVISGSGGAAAVDEGSRCAQPAHHQPQLLHVEGAQRAAVAALPRLFARSGRMAAALADLVWGPSEPLPELLAQFPLPTDAHTHAHSAAAALGGDATAATAPTAIVRGRIFDRELDNHHEEPLFFAQLSARELRALATQAVEAVPPPSSSSARGGAGAWLDVLRGACEARARAAAERVDAAAARMHAAATTTEGEGVCIMHMCV